MVSKALIPQSLNSVYLTGFRYFSYQVATQLSLRGWVDPVPDPILPEKFLLRFISNYCIAFPYFGAASMTKLTKLYKNDKTNRHRICVIYLIEGGLVAQAIRRSPPTARVPCSPLGHFMWVSWWMKRGLGRFISGFLPFFTTTNFIPPFLQSTPVVQGLSYSPLDPRFAGSIPAGVDGFFQSVKILSMTSFGRDVKLRAPCRRFTARKRTLSRN